MATILCVLYDDPVDGYPTSYARDDIPVVEHYFDGQTTPSPAGDRLPARRAARQRLRRARPADVPRRAGPPLRRHVGQGRRRLRLRAGAAERRRRDLAAVLAGLPDGRANRAAPNLKLAITAGIGSDHVDLEAAIERRDHRRRGDLLQQHQRRRARRDDDPRPRPQLHPVVPVGRRGRLEHRRLRLPLVRPRGHAGRDGRRGSYRFSGAEATEAVRGRPPLHRPAPPAGRRRARARRHLPRRPSSRWSRCATSSRSTRRCTRRPSTSSTTR